MRKPYRINPSRAFDNSRRALGLTLFLLASHCAVADEYHYINMLIGDRPAGLGGAYVAVADDPAGLFYNPAGIVEAGRANLSASMNAYNMSRTEYKNVLGGKHDWIRTSAGLKPNFFGITQPLGPGTFGISYAVTDSIVEDQDQTFPDIPAAGNRFTINYHSNDSSYNVGPSYAIRITPRWSIGLTVYGYARNREESLNQQFTLKDRRQDANGNPLDKDGKVIAINPDGTPTDPSTSFVEDDTYHWVNSYSQVDEYGVRPVLGLMWSPTDKVTLGASLSKIKLFTAHLFSQDSCATNDRGDGKTTACPLNTFVQQKIEANYDREFPLIANGGIAYFPSSTLLFSTAVWLYEPQYGQRKPTWNAAIGTEYYVSPEYAVRLGAFTNHSNTPQFSDALTDQREHIDLYGGSFSLSHFTRTSALTVGAVASTGTGKAQIFDGTTATQAMRIYGLTLFISASHTL